jgi:lysozyme
MPPSLLDVLEPFWTNAMNMSAAGRRALIEAFEGLRESAYRDCAGVLTIGYGHTTAAGPPKVVPGLRLTPAEADAALARDLARVETGVARLLRMPPQQRELDALVDFAFNVGLGALRSSTLLRLYNRGDRAGAAQAFLAWDRCGGRVVAGLARRRAAERAWFLGLELEAASTDVAMAHAADPVDSLARRARNRVALLTRPPVTP